MSILSILTVGLASFLLAGSATARETSADAGETQHGAAEIRAIPPTNSPPATVSPAQPGFTAPPVVLKRYSAAEIGNMFDRPTNALQLLGNLKLALDRDLLLQPEFFADANLMKFFNGTKVKWRQPDLSDPTEKLRRRGRVTVDGNAFPNMTVQLIASAWLDLEYNASTGSNMRGRKRSSGVVILQAQEITGVTARAVTSVFGPNPQKSFDSGVDTDAHVHAPTSKGWFIYENRRDDDPGRSFDKLARFTFKLDSPSDQTLPMPRMTFKSDDIVQRVYLYELE
jgi:hypothetical protein